MLVKDRFHAEHLLTIGFSPEVLPIIKAPEYSDMRGSTVRAEGEHLTRHDRLAEAGMFLRYVRGKVSEADYDLLQAVFTAPESVQSFNRKYEAICRTSFRLKPASQDLEQYRILVGQWCGIKGPKCKISRVTAWRQRNTLRRELDAAMDRVMA